MKLEIITSDRDHAILVCDEDHNDIAEFYHSDHATVSQSYETALTLAKQLVEVVNGVAQTPALDAILEALKPFAALGMPRGRAVDTARVDIWERANHGDTRVLLTSPSQQGGSVTLSTADFRAAHDALAAPQQSSRLERDGVAEMLKRNGFTSRDGTVIAADTLGVIDAILAMTVVSSTDRGGK